RHTRSTRDWSSDVCSSDLLLALLLFHNELNVIGLIGIILLIGIVKKNAILMIDFAVQVERLQEKPAVEAIYQACLLRFRPIMMTDRKSTRLNSSHEWISYA